MYKNTSPYHKGHRNAKLLAVFFSFRTLNIISIIYPKIQSIQRAPFLEQENLPLKMIHIGFSHRHIHFCAFQERYILSGTDAESNVCHTPNKIPNACNFSHNPFPFPTFCLSCKFCCQFCKLFEAELTPGVRRKSQLPRPFQI